MPSPEPAIKICGSFDNLYTSAARNAFDDLKRNSFARFHLEFKFQVAGYSNFTTYLKIRFLLGQSIIRALLTQRSFNFKRTF